MSSNFLEMLSEDIQYFFDSWSAFFYCENGMIKNFIRSFFGSALERKDEVEIMYFGRISDALMMTSERIGVPVEKYTLEQMLNRLRQRGDRWVYELDDSHLVFSINSKNASLSDNLKVGDEIGIFSRKSMFEM